MRFPLYRLVLEPIEHHTAVPDLPVIQGSDLDLLKRGREGLTAEDIGIAHQPRPGPIDLATIALEAERVVPIGPHLAAVFESRFALLARRAHALATVGATLIFAGCHRTPSTPFGCA